MKKHIVMVRIISILCLATVLMSCHRQSSDLLSFEIEKAFSNNRVVSIGDIASELSYIRLEINEKCIVGNNPRVFATDNCIVVIAQGRIMLFDRETGNYLHDIGSEGRGPEEYSYVSFLLPVDYVRNSVFAVGDQKLLEFDFNGNFLQSVSIPQSITNSILLDENHFVSFFPNSTGENKTKIGVYTIGGDETTRLSNYQKAPNDGGSFSFWMPHAWYFKHNNEVFFSELFNDTIYLLTPHEITPRMVLGLGKYLPPYEQQNSMQSSSGFADKYFMLRNIHESSRYIFYSYRYKENIHTAVYDKMNSVSAISLKGGFSNDIDNFIPISLSSINQSDEMVGVINAYEVAQWFDANKVVELPGNLANHKSMTDNDNPLVVIAKLKK